MMTLRDMLDAGITIQGTGRIAASGYGGRNDSFYFQNEDDLAAYQIPEDMLDLEVMYIFSDENGLNIEVREE